MKWIQGKAREQAVLFPTSLDDIIAEDNEVRLIDLFVESLSLETYGFNVRAVEDGRPKYHPKVLLKVFIYGYMNRVRSSRLFERACKINVEVMWLVQQLSPDHNTINNFRKILKILTKNTFLLVRQIIVHYSIESNFHNLILNSKISRANKHILGLSF